MYKGMRVVKKGTSEEHEEWDLSYEDDYLVSSHSLVEYARLAWYFGPQRRRGRNFNVFYEKTFEGKIIEYVAAAPACVNWMRPALKKPALIPGVCVSETGKVSGPEKDLILRSIARREAGIIITEALKNTSLFFIYGQPTQRSKESIRKELS